MMERKVSGNSISSLIGERLHVCSGCNELIKEQWLLEAAEKFWHENCLKCSSCEGPLAKMSDTFYAKADLLLCKRDYFRLYGAKCTGCCEKISASELVMKALDSIFHLNCFTCVGCNKQLKKGDQYVIRSGRLFCRPDFEKELAILQMSTQTSENAVVPNNNQNSPIPSGQNTGSTVSVTSSQRQDGRRGPKRPRTILTTAQRRAFKASFEVSQKPCRKVRESLAKETGLSVRIVQVWFQNQRAKLKKIQRKQQQLQQQSHQQHTTNSDSNAGLGDKSNLDKMSPYSRLGHSGSGHLTDSSVDSPSFSVAPIQYLSHSPDDDSYYSPHGDGYSKGDLGMDSETSLGGLDDVLQGNGASNGGDESLSHHPHTHHHHHHHQGSSSMDNNNNNNSNNIPSGSNGSTNNGLFGSSMTPIDKLYSMQNSYFNSNECECLGPSN